jgi:hypothetical protein
VVASRSTVDVGVLQAAALTAVILGILENRVVEARVGVSIGVDGSRVVAAIGIKVHPGLELEIDLVSAPRQSHENIATGVLGHGACTDAAEGAGEEGCGSQGVHGELAELFEEKGRVESKNENW